MLPICFCSSVAILIEGRRVEGSKYPMSEEESSIDVIYAVMAGLVLADNIQSLSLVMFVCKRAFVVVS